MRLPFRCFLITKGAGHASVAVICVLMCASSRDKREQHSSKPQASAPASADPHAHVSSRAIYPYSVLPGGAYDQGELLRGRLMDPVVGRHYSDFGERITVQITKQDHWYYVSYRKGNAIFWTTKRHRVPKGEALLRDAEGRLARARCANRLSSVARRPTLARNEPDERALSNIDSLKPDQQSWMAEPEYDFLQDSPPDVSPTENKLFQNDLWNGDDSSKGLSVVSMEPLPKQFAPLTNEVIPRNPTSTPEPGSFLLMSVVGVLALPFPLVNFVKRRNRVRVLKNGKWKRIRLFLFGAVEAYSLSRFVCLKACFRLYRQEDPLNLAAGRQLVREHAGAIEELQGLPSRSAD